MGQRSYDGRMRQGTPRATLTRAGLTVLLGYVLASQLLLTALAGTAQATRSVAGAGGGAGSLHALCASGPAGGGATNPSEHAHGHDGPCCTLACLGGLGFSPPSVTAVSQPAPAVAPVVRASSLDLGTRPATAPPGRGQGPRAPPSA